MRHHPGFRGHLDQREACGEALSRTGHEGLLCTAAIARASGADRRRDGCDREPPRRGRELGGGRPEAWPEAEHAAKGGVGGPDSPSRQKKDCEPIAASTKRQRSEIDCAAPMGRGATATLERMAASLGPLEEVELSFNRAVDLPHGGVLLALPALLVSGLLSHTSKYFSLPAGFYGLKTIFLLLAFMSLSRIKSIEALRYYAPGEWGKLLGVDRAPEVRTLQVP